MDNLIIRFRSIALKLGDFQGTQAVGTVSRSAFSNHIADFFPLKQFESFYLQTDMKPRTLFEALGADAVYYKGSNEVPSKPGSVDPKNVVVLGTFDDQDSIIGLMQTDNRSRVIYITDNPKTEWAFSPVLTSDILKFLEIGTSKVATT